MNEQPLSVERQLTLLRMAARVDPHLRQAVVDVEAYIDALRTENAELRAALNQQGHIAEFREDGWSLEHPLECRATGLNRLPC